MSDALPASHKTPLYYTVEIWSQANSRWELYCTIDTKERAERMALDVLRNHRRPVRVQGIIPGSASMAVTSLDRTADDVTAATPKKRAKRSARSRRRRRAGR